MMRVEQNTLRLIRRTKNEALNNWQGEQREALDRIRAKYLPILEDCEQREKELVESIWQRERQDAKEAP